MSAAARAWAASPQRAAMAIDRLMALRLVSFPVLSIPFSFSYSFPLRLCSDLSCIPCLRLSSCRILRGQQRRLLPVPALLILWTPACGHCLLLGMEVPAQLPPPESCSKQ